MIKPLLILALLSPLMAFSKSKMEKLVDELTDERERMERFITTNERENKHGCQFFVITYNEKKKKIIKDVLDSKKVPKDAYLLDDVEDMNLEMCANLTEKYYFER